MNPKRITLTTTIGIMLATPAVADVTAAFNAGSSDDVITIEYRDDNHVRMALADGGYIVVTDGKGYFVSRSGSDWSVYAVEDFAAMFARTGLGAMAADAIASDTSTVELRDTGRSETVAGIRGSVHEVITSDGWSGGEVTGEVVLSDDADAREAFRGMMRITQLMGEMAGQQGLDQLNAYGNDGRAVLRADDDWRLVSLERGEIPDRYFTLPAEPTAMPNFAGLGAGSAQDGQSGGGFLDSWLGREAQGVGTTAADEARAIGNEAEQEARQGVTEGVRRGVQEGIRGLFGR